MRRKERNTTAEILLQKIADRAADNNEKHRAVKVIAEFSWNRDSISSVRPRRLSYVEQRALRFPARRQQAMVIRMNRMAIRAGWLWPYGHSPP